jgi:hypothetical protein
MHHHEQILIFPWCPYQLFHGISKLQLEHPLHHIEQPKQQIASSIKNNYSIIYKNIVA